ncbi:unknown [Prevotella sp. CAG:487]|nr:unknown [Prevotella sp. CAG:487]
MLSFTKKHCPILLHVYTERATAALTRLGVCVRLAPRLGVCVRLSPFVWLFIPAARCQRTLSSVMLPMMRELPLPVFSICTVTELS